MRKLYSVVVALVLAAVVAPGTARADEPYLEFLQGLRDLRYYEYALLYLDTIRDNPNTPADIRAVIPYEKATTLLAKTRASTIKNPQTQADELDKALGFLKEFTATSPNHPKAAEANTERARILLGRARVEVWQSRSPGNKDNRATFQETARELIAEARAIFQTAHDGHKAKWESYPSFVDRVEDRQLFEDRRQAEIRYIMAQLDLANCTYEESQTYDRDSDEYAARLKDGAKEYQGVHERYRSQVGGLYARLWQGKCFEEQDDIQRAVGIYKELLGHPGKSNTMRRLQAQTLQFYLICLNHESRKDYQLVVDKGSEWLSSISARERLSSSALGIQWEMVLAWEALGTDRSASEAQRKRTLGTALATVRRMMRLPGQYKDLATFKERDLQILVTGKEAIEPDTFDTAFSLGADMVTKQTKKLKDQLKNAKNAEERRNFRQDLDLHLEESARMLRIALRLTDEKTPTRELNLARFYLAYTYLLMRNNYEAAVLVEFVANNYGKDDPTMAQDSANMAIAAYVQAFNDNERRKRHKDQEIDVARMSAMAEFLVANWPSSDRAMDARMQMGNVNSQLRMFDEAATWYGQIPETSSKYTVAQTQAGQSFWSAYIEAAQADAIDQPPKETLDSWMASAEAHLRKGIDRAEVNTPAGSAAPDSLVAAKVSLVQILVAARKYPEALTILTGDPHSVRAAIQVPDEAARPKEDGSVKSVAFASLVYQLLLRCYVGSQDLDNAQEAMESLEKVGGGDAAALTAIYQSLGQELQKELERLKSLNQIDAYNEVRTSFETFLDKMYQREAQTAGSLYWIAITYFGLAQGSKGDNGEITPDAGRFFDAAANTYQAILDRGLVEEKRLAGVKLRLANCRRNQEEFDQADALIKAVLAEKLNSLDAQLEANFLYQSWGTSGVADGAARLQTAIRGDESAKMWGWGKTATRLQRMIDHSAENAEQFTYQFYEARYNLALCRIALGGLQATDAKRDAEIERAISEINSFVRITPDFDDEWFDKFSAVYLDCFEAMNRNPEALERPIVYQPPAAVVEESTAGGDGDGSKSDTSKPPGPMLTADSGGSSMTYILFGVIGLIGIGGAGFMVMKGGKRKPTSALAVAGDGEAPAIDASAFAVAPAGAGGAPIIGPPPAVAAAPAGATPKKKRPLTDEQKKALLAKKKRAAAAAAAGETGTEAEAPKKKKRPLTPEEKEILLKKKRAKAAAEAKKKKEEEG